MRSLKHFWRKKSIYLCVSYDADLVAIESLTGFVREWIAFTKKHENLTIEIRTKSGRCDLWSNYEACDRVIIAYTVSPQRVAAEYEHFCVRTYGADSGSKMCYG